MDKINADGGFMGGIFGRKKKRSGSDTENKIEPKPSDTWKRLPEGIRNEFLAMSGEFVGTFMFLFFAFAGTHIANTPRTGGTSDATGPDTSVLLYIALSFGFSLAVNAWVFFRVTGGLFNPAVTLGLCLIGAVPFLRGALVFISQMLGAMAASAVVQGLFPGPLGVSTTLAAGTSLVQGLFIEMFLTAQLVFTIFMLAAEKHKSTFLAPVGIGLSLFIAEIAGAYYTGGSLNPARSFGPCVALRSFPSEHWIYWVGPLLGALVASGFFWFIKSCEYEAVNPGQDFDDLEASAYDPESDLSRPVIKPNAELETSRSRGSDSGPDTRTNRSLSGRQSQPQNQYHPPQDEEKQYQTEQDWNARNGSSRRPQDGHNRRSQERYARRSQRSREAHDRRSQSYTIGAPNNQQYAAHDNQYANQDGYHHGGYHNQYDQQRQ